jgi:hypothetical protein
MTGTVRSHSPQMQCAPADDSDAFRLPKASIHGMLAKTTASSRERGALVNDSMPQRAGDSVRQR